MKSLKSLKYSNEINENLCVYYYFCFLSVSIRIEIEEQEQIGTTWVNNCSNENMT